MLSWFILTHILMVILASASMFSFYHKAKKVANGQDGEGVLELSKKAVSVTTLFNQVRDAQHSLVQRAENVQLIAEGALPIRTLDPQLLSTPPTLDISSNDSAVNDSVQSRLEN